IGSAGTVDTGAVDDLAGIARLCAAEALWFHIDAAFGALAMLSPAQRPLLDGMDKADSLAFDFHKWAQVPYDAGCVLVRDGAAHAEAFASHVDYLKREKRGLAAGHPWPTDFGPDLSRGFRALKVWMTLKVYGADKLGQVVARSCALAGELEALVAREAELELLSPVALNIVCFRYIASDKELNRLNIDIVIALQESGIAVASTTNIGDKLAIRAALVNHRTTPEDIRILLAAVLDIGRGLAA
ncbi:MAG TPA: pyridoxal-dependent decarboxylase, partial [Janthinobacterium sp.]|nr:pyridoxal-dependent decarboxylase [Janthinobacterium sp.]